MSAFRNERERYYANRNDAKQIETAVCSSEKEGNPAYDLRQVEFADFGLEKEAEEPIEFELESINRIEEDVQEFHALECE